MSSGRQAIGGDVDEDGKYISPTVLTDILSSDPIMQEEVKQNFQLLSQSKDNKVRNHVLCLDIWSSVAYNYSE